MSTECPQLTPSHCQSPPPAPLPLLPSHLLTALPSPLLIAMALPNLHQVLPNPHQTATAPPQFSLHPSRRLAPPPQPLMNTFLPVRTSPPPSPTPPPMTPASVQTFQIHSGLRTVLGPASLTVTAHPASRTPSSATTAAWTAMAAPHHMTPRRCPACQDDGNVANV